MAFVQKGLGYEEMTHPEPAHRDKVGLKKISFWDWLAVLFDNPAGSESLGAAP